MVRHLASALRAVVSVAYRPDSKIARFPGRNDPTGC